MPWNTRDQTDSLHLHFTLSLSIIVSATKPRAACEGVGTILLSAFTSSLWCNRTDIVGRIVSILHKLVDLF